MQVNVPGWFFCLSAEAFARFIAEHNLHRQLHPKADLNAFAADVEELFCSLPLPKDVQRALEDAIAAAGFDECFVAVRSSGLEEDSASFSFAGQFSSFLFQKGQPAIENSIKRCWALGFFRAMSKLSHETRFAF